MLFYVQLTVASTSPGLLRQAVLPLAAVIPPVVLAVCIPNLEFLVNKILYLSYLYIVCILFI